MPQDLATYVENTPSFENKIREVAGTAELVVEDGSAVIAKVNVYDDSTYLPLTGNNPGDQAFATDTDILYIWDGSAWQQAGAANSDDLTEGSTNLFFTDARADARIALQSGANLDLSGKSTTDLSEGTNLYYTDARVDSRLASGSIGNLVVGGNLTVNGTTTTINSTTLNVDDLNITLASGAASTAAANGAGITIDGAGAIFAWNSTQGSMTLNKELRLDNNKGLFFSNTAANATLGIKADTSDNITFRQNGSWDRLVIKNAGVDVSGVLTPSGGIVIPGAVNSPPTIRLDMAGNLSQGSVTGKIEFYNADDTDNTPGVFGIIQGVAGPSGGEGSLQFLVNMPSEGTDASSIAMHLNSNGNVGIGVTDPDAPLVVKSSSGGSTFKLIGRSADNISSLTFANAGNTAYNYIQGNGSFIRARADSGFHFRKGSTPVTTDSSGFTIQGLNVGIGTSSPAAKLHIVPTSFTQPSLIIDTPSGYSEGDMYVLHGRDANSGIGFSSTAFGVNVQPEIPADNIPQLRSNTGGLTAAGLMYVGADDVSQGVFGVMGATGNAGTDLEHLFTVKSDGKVGIGVTDPDSALEVQSSSADKNSVHIANTSSTSYGAKFLGGGNTATRYIADFRDYNNLSKVKIDGDGRVIMTHAMDVIRGAYGAYQALNLENTNGNNGVLSGVSLAMKVSGGLARIDMYNSSNTDTDSSNIIFKTGDGGAATERMRINSLGNVGIGTSSMEAAAQAIKVEVESGSNYRPMRLRFVDDNNGATNNPLAFEYKAGLEIENGYSGAGPSANGTKIAKLSLTTVTSSGYGATGSIFVTTNAGTGYNSGELAFAVGHNSSGLETEAMRINKDGKVGIGTDNPQAKLNISGSSENIRLDNTGTSNYGLEIWRGGNKGASFAWGEGNANLEIKNYRNDSQADGPYANIDFFTGGTNANSGGSPAYSPDLRMRIQQTGEVGIGTSNPRSKLEVNGDGIIFRLDGSPNTSRSMFFRNTSTTNHAQIYADGTLKLWTEDPNTSILLAPENNSNYTIEHNANGFAPAQDNQLDLGRYDKGWKNVYTNDLQLSNMNSEEGNEVDGTNGKWTIQEGEEELFIINRLTGKKYAFMLREIE